MSKKTQITDNTYMMYSEDEHGVYTTIINKDKGNEKVVLDHQEHYSEAGEKQKNVGFNYNDDGTLSHWTVEERTSTVTDEGDEVTIRTGQYKKDDIKAITSGDVPGYAYIDAHLQLSDDKGEPVWVKEAREKANKKIKARKTAKTAQKKSTANAIKAQKGSQYVMATSQSDALTTPWAKDSQKKVEAKTAQKAKTTKIKTTAQKPTKTSGGRS